MPLKHWSFAGLLLTYWCNARCASCYLCCSPERREEMTVEDALAFWEGLIEASPNGCRIHISGGEPFGNFPLLITLCRAAQQEHLGPLEQVETNAFWADQSSTVRDRLEALDAAGMRKLVVSADPYHQQFVPIERCRLAARVAEEVLGTNRVQVRWREWLAEGFNTDQLDEERRSTLFAKYAVGARDRLTGRAAEQIAVKLQSRPAESFADNPCRERLLRSKHVHVDPAGRIAPGVCVGIVLGWATKKSIPEIWRGLAADHAGKDVLHTLAEKGPVGLLPIARDSAFVPRVGYAGKCHLCWDIRKHLARSGLFQDELGPVWIYEDEGNPQENQLTGGDKRIIKV